MFRPKKAIFFPPRFARRVCRSGQTGSETRIIVREGRSVRDAEPTFNFASPQGHPCCCWWLPCDRSDCCNGKGVKPFSVFDIIKSASFVLVYVQQRMVPELIHICNNSRTLLKEPDTTHGNNHDRLSHYCRAIRLDSGSYALPVLLAGCSHGAVNCSVLLRSYGFTLARAATHRHHCASPPLFRAVQRGRMLAASGKR